MNARPSEIHRQPAPQQCSGDAAGHPVALAEALEPEDAGTAHLHAGARRREGVRLVGERVHAVRLAGAAPHPLQREGQGVEHVPEVDEEGGQGELGQRRDRDQEADGEEFHGPGVDEHGEDERPPPVEARLHDEEPEGGAQREHADAHRDGVDEGGREGRPLRVRLASRRRMMVCSRRDDTGPAKQGWRRHEGDVQTHQHRGRGLAGPGERSTRTSSGARPCRRRATSRERGSTGARACRTRISPGSTCGCPGTARAGRRSRSTATAATEPRLGRRRQPRRHRPHRLRGGRRRRGDPARARARRRAAWAT